MAFETSQFFTFNLSQCITSGFLEPPILVTIHSLSSRVIPPSSSSRVILFCDYHQQLQNVKRLESVLPWKVARPNQHLNFIPPSSKKPLEPITQSRSPEQCSENCPSRVAARVFKGSSSQSLVIVTGSCSCSTLVIRAHYFVPLSSSFLAVTCHDRFDRDVFSSSSLFSSCFAIFHTNLETVTNWSRRPKTYQYLQHARNHLASMFPIKLFKYAIYIHSCCWVFRGEKNHWGKGILNFSNATSWQHRQQQH